MPPLFSPGRFVNLHKYSISIPANFVHFDD